MLAQDTAASRGCHCSAVASTSSRSQHLYDLQQQQMHMHFLSQQQPQQLQQAPAGQLAEQQAPVPMRSPFLAAQHYDDAEGTLGSFAGQLLEELQHCVPFMHAAVEGPSQQAHRQNHHQHQHQQQQHLHLQHHQQRLSQSARLPVRTSWLGYDGSECADQYHSKQHHSEEFYSDSESEPAAEHMPAHHPAGNTAEVRALLENCLEEAAERARSQTLQSSGLYILGSESSLCSSCSIANTAQPSMTSSGAVAIDWEAMLRSELHEAGVAKADLEGLTGDGASSLQCAADGGIDKDDVQSARTATVLAAVTGQQPLLPAGAQDA